MKLTALMVATTIRTVSSVAWSDVGKNVLPPGNGSQVS